MELMLTIVIFLIGIVLIVKGGDYFVDAASWVAEVSGIPKLIVGATIVSVATTLPELLVSVMAASQGKVDMSIGNAVGSVTANIGLIMAISLICMPGVINRSDYLLKSVLMMTAALVIVVGGIMGQVDMPLSVALLAIFIVFIYENVKSAKLSISEENAEKNPEEIKKPQKKEILLNSIKFIAGAAGGSNRGRSAG